MAKVKNPRFPHHCRILRYAATEAMEDQQKVYDPMQDEEPLEDVQDGEGEESQGEGESSPINSPSEPTVIYEGECRSDNRDTVSDNGEVISSYRTLALPIKQDEWTEDTIPLEGDRIELQRFGYTEYGLVIDKRPSNLGTHILWRYVRN
jgi:hypothetical protein